MLALRANVISLLAEHGISHWQIQQDTFWHRNQQMLHAHFANTVLNRTPNNYPVRRDPYLKTGWLAYMNGGIWTDNLVHQANGLYCPNLHLGAKLELPQLQKKLFWAFLHWWNFRYQTVCAPSIWNLFDVDFDHFIDHFDNNRVIGNNCGCLTNGKISKLLKWKSTIYRQYGLWHFIWYNGLERCWRSSWVDIR